jgi:hypothetical protein
MFWEGKRLLLKRQKRLRAVCDLVALWAYILLQPAHDFRPTGIKTLRLAYLLEKNQPSPFAGLLPAGLLEYWRWQAEREEGFVPPRRGFGGMGAETLVLSAGGLPVNDAPAMIGPLRSGGVRSRLVRLIRLSASCVPPVSISPWF